MWVSILKLVNIRGFVNETTLKFAKNINILVGQNNAGKTTVLNSIFLLQDQNILSSKDISLGKQQGTVEIYFKGYREYIEKLGQDAQDYNLVRKTFNRNPNSIDSIIKGAGGGVQFKSFPNTEPQNVIYPYLSKRKVINYNESVNLQATNSVTGNFEFLTAKIARLCNINHPQSQIYQDACRDIIGFPISTVASSNGQKAAYLVNSFTEIPLNVMGEGVPNLLGLVVDLSIAEDKIFLIEEPENDIHPKALKALLGLIERKSENNQFIISTHSNIVTKYLGSVEDSKVFKVSMSFDEKTRLPISKVVEVPNEPIARLSLLEELGYEPFDFGQWKAWLILEESSAEVIIRDFLIPTFVPKLKNKLRTYSAGSLSEVEPKFKDFNNLFVFIHLEQSYKNKAWVIVDAGEKESEIIDKMREIYNQSGWNKEQFLQFEEHDFEKYYPARFQEQVSKILSMTDRQKKRENKQILVEEVKQWIKENPEAAKAEFAESASEVINILKNVAKQIE